MDSSTQSGHDEQSLEQLRLSALLQKIAAQDHRAMRDFHCAVAARLYVMARSTLKSHECAQEIVSDVLFRVWNKSSDYDSARGTVMAWLMVMARSRARDRFRAQQSRRATDSRYAIQDVALAHSSPAVLSSRECAVYRSALKDLPTVRRLVLDMAFVAGLTHIEIAERVGIPVGTVKSHLRRALSSMRGSLQHAV